METGFGAGASTGLMPPISPDPGSRISYAPREFLDTYYDDEPDMPNFDAIPNSRAGPTDEMGLESPKPNGPSATWGAGHPGQGHPGQRQPSVPNQFETAGFQFDIPSDGSSMPSYDRNRGYPQNGYGPGHQNGATYEAPQTYPQHQPPPPVQNGNPDALPHHPAPFRPGHDQAAKPVPVRQYGSAPNPHPTPNPVSIQANGPAPGSLPVAESGPEPLASQMTPAKAEESRPITHDELQKLQMSARGNPEDQGLQLKLAKKLVEASVVLVAENTHLDPKMKAKAQEKYTLDAHKIVKKLASAGFAEAQFYLADCYGEGRLGLQVDAKEAFSLYLSAAKAGHAQSAYRVAVCCEIGAEEGGGTRRDPFKAVQWYKRAAALGDTPAMYKMGMINLKGLLGQKSNPREGVSWLKRAAERADEENPHALHELALMYQSASGNDIIVRDEAYASQLFHQAADLGYKFSQFRLGTAYEYGLLGCPVDNRMSIIWYTRAAAQGEHQSELALSGWYLTGSEGILQQNDTEAYLWARKAAAAGLAKAEYAMGYYTEVGIGVTANLEDAKRWYWRAAAQGFPKARERLEDLRRGGGRYEKTRLSRSAVSKQSEGDCVLM
ncbi:Chitin synthase regulatory factor 3 [Penicillium diatomitis]|uniref:Chitin synthase regulatory factor 3 n=1 Tax=Penicillium diatomitis TaxID=2819901 RepID=A0A9W9X5P5_9EURO|nr:Chitin synthase regulatory factor 3 [Penicillium diatomitis]KAJ5484839.1 Chitin synthase regulatory factor 3 [Penicillium diatomitis]